MPCDPVAKLTAESLSATIDAHNQENRSNLSKLMTSAVSSSTTFPEVEDMARKCVVLEQQNVELQLKVMQSNL